MAGRLIDSDPALAKQHALAAKYAAPRLPIVREAVGEAAYAAADYAEALSEFRALRRMTGTDEYVPAMADCERALGRYQGALKLIKEGLESSPETAAMVELRLVEAGVRADTGQVPEALRLLQAEIESVGNRGPKLARGRLRYAYADLLEFTGQIEAAERWFAAAASLDPEESTDAADRVARLRGLVIEYDDSEDELFVEETEAIVEVTEEGIEVAEESISVSQSEPAVSDMTTEELDGSEDGEDSLPFEAPHGGDDSSPEEDAEHADRVHSATESIDSSLVGEESEGATSEGDAVVTEQDLPND